MRTNSFARFWNFENKICKDYKRLKKVWSHSAHVQIIIEYYDEISINYSLIISVLSVRLFVQMTRKLTNKLREAPVVKIFVVVLWFSWKIFFQRFVYVIFAVREYAPCKIFACQLSYETVLWLVLFELFVGIYIYVVMIVLSFHDQLIWLFD